MFIAISGVLFWYVVPRSLLDKYTAMMLHNSIRCLLRCLAALLLYVHSTKKSKDKVRPRTGHEGPDGK
jgi:hypothetical protein